MFHKNAHEELPLPICNKSDDHAAGDGFGEHAGEDKRDDERSPYLRSERLPWERKSDVYSEVGETHTMQQELLKGRLAMASQRRMCRSDQYVAGSQENQKERKGQRMGMRDNHL